MDIKNPTEFRNFVTANNFKGLHKDLSAVAMCIMDYERGCDCWKASDRQKIYNNCVILYQRAVNTAHNSFKSQFMSGTGDQQITFYLEGRVLSTLRR